MTPIVSFTYDPISLWAMLGGGLLAFVSPCVLPMLPIYGVYLMGGTEDEQKPGRWAVMLRCAGLLVGFVLFYTLIGAGAGLLGSALKHADRGMLDIVSGVLMMVFGLWMIDLFRLGFLHMPSFLTKSGCRMNGFGGSFLFGLLMALSFSSCLSPVLANALVMAASADGATMWTGVASLTVFGLGICLPMLAIMLMYQWLKGLLGWLRTHQVIIRRVGGAVMIAYGAYMVLKSVV